MNDEQKQRIAEAFAALLNASNVGCGDTITKYQETRLAEAHEAARRAYRDLTGQEFEYQEDLS